MIRLKKRPETSSIAYIDEQAHPGYYGLLWEPVYSRSKKLMLVRNWDEASGTEREELYQWVDEDLIFLHVGKFKTLQDALNKAGEVYKFDSLSELTKWVKDGC